MKDNGEEYVLPKLNKTSDELFFIGYAQVNDTFGLANILVRSQSGSKITHTGQT